MPLDEKFCRRKVCLEQLTCILINEVDRFDLVGERVITLQIIAGLPLLPAKAANSPTDRSVWSLDNPIVAARGLITFLTFTLFIASFVVPLCTSLGSVLPEHPRFHRLLIEQFPLHGQYDSCMVRTHPMFGGFLDDHSIIIID